MATELTFTLDEARVGCLEDAAARLSLPKDQVVREAIREFWERIGMLSERDKIAMLRALDQFLTRPPAGDARAVDHELLRLRESRRSGGRRVRSQGI